MTLMMLTVEFVVLSAMLLGAARLGTSATVTVVAAMQLMQSILAASFYWEVGRGFLLSPGSCVLFASNIAILLYFYVRFGAERARTIFYAIVGANLVVVVLNALVSLHIQIVEPVNLLGVPPRLFSVSVASAVIGAVVLTITQIVALAIFNLASRQGAPIAVAMTTALVVALSFDTVAYLLPLFWGDPNLASMLESGMVAKAAGGLVFGVVWGTFLQLDGRRVDEESLRELFAQIAFSERGDIRSRFIGSLGSDLRFFDWLDEIPEGIAVVSGGRIETTNRAFQRIAGEAGTGVSPEDIFGEKAMSELFESVGRDSDVAHQFANGTHASSRAFRAGFRGGEAIVIVSQDVSERESLRAQVSHADRLASIGTLAAGVAHEVNNPMAFLTANQSVAIEMLQGLRDEAPEFTETIDRIVESLEDANHGAERVKKVVEQLMTLSRSDTNDVDLCDMNGLIESNVGISRAHVEGVAELRLEMAPLPPIEANANLLSQVLLNLLLNAAQAVRENPSAEHFVEVRAWPTARAVVIEIEDSGPGIPDEIADRIMEPFFTTKPAGKGTGLGLATSRSIVESLGGELTFESEPGEGATFRVTLPFARQSPRIVQR